MPGPGPISRAGPASVTSARAQGINSVSTRHFHADERQYQWWILFICLLSPGFRDLLDVTFLNRFQDGAGAIADTQLPEDVGYIIFDGSFRESQRGGDLTITVSSGHQTENLSFARRQLFFVIRRRRKRRSRQSTPETFRDHRTDHRSATSYQPDRFSQLRQRNVF